MPKPQGQSTIYLDPDLKAAITKRANSNRRTVSQEICFLIEVALATELDVDINFMRNVFLSQGGAKSLVDDKSE